MKAKIKIKASASKAESVPTIPASVHISNTARENRESYLERAVEGFAQWFTDNGKTTLPAVRVACGFPGGRGSKKILGACWDANSSKEKKSNIFISPLIDDTATVLFVLCHELVHACVGHDEGHGPGFRRLSRMVGLRGKMTATVPSNELAQFIGDVLIPELGQYPHAKLSLDDNPAKKQGTRMIKCVCKKSGYTVRTTKQWLDKYGAPISPVTDKKMVIEWPADTEVEEGQKEGAAK